jgi:hypothetical protein
MQHSSMIQFTIIWKIIHNASASLVIIKRQFVVLCRKLLSFCDYSVLRSSRRCVSVYVWAAGCPLLLASEASRCTFWCFSNLAFSADDWTLFGKMFLSSGAGTEQSVKRLATLTDWTTEMPGLESRKDQGWPLHVVGTKPPRQCPSEALHRGKVVRSWIWPVTTTMAVGS